MVELFCSLNGWRFLTVAVCVSTWKLIIANRIPHHHHSNPPTYPPTNEPTEPTHSPTHPPTNQPTNLGSLHGADEGEVALHEVGVGLLAEAVVVQLVVLHAPGLGQHPVEPLRDASPQRPHREVLAVKLARGIRVAN